MTTYPAPQTTELTRDDAERFQELEEYLDFFHKLARKHLKERRHTSAFRAIKYGLLVAVDGVASLYGSAANEDAAFAERVDQTADLIDDESRELIKEAYEMCNDGLLAKDGQPHDMVSYAVCLEATKRLKDAIAKLTSPEVRAEAVEPIQKGGMKSDRLAIREALESGKYDHIDNVTSCFEGPSGNVERVSVSVQGPVVKVARSVGGNPLRSGTHTPFVNAETRELTGEDAVTFIANHPWYFELH